MTADPGVLQLALMVSLLSGFSTGVGGLLVVLQGKPTDASVGIMEAFSAGVMLYLSIGDLWWPAAAGEVGPGLACFAFVVGAVLFGLVLRLVPDEQIMATFALSSRSDSSRSIRTGLITMATISLHNFPEGVAVLLSTMRGLKVGVLFAVALSLHNVPEGMSVAAPVYYATHNVGLAIGLPLLSGLFEPLGAALAGLLLLPYVTEFRLLAMLSVVGGIMAGLSIQELLPSGVQHAGRRRASVACATGACVCFATLRVLDWSLG
eukprot:TRINITY_DN2095_c0_g1_i2.p1 TRINITY_DN2095_c0_g1~~TRINITY_DN2095_c0_g1_i2.p1  ORF type:complete len:263 (-),score=68.09 TRINITY_DN2095_c0_g1_i2:174-962(-)